MAAELSYNRLGAAGDDGGSRAGASRLLHMTRSVVEAPADRVEGSTLPGVSRETAGRLEIYANELRRWQRVTNLVGPRALEELWARHFADSLQLASLSDAVEWADIGSGAGFPGLVIAIARPDLRMTLIESDGRKCAFLRHVVRLTGAPATVCNARAESALDNLRPQVVTARAVAPLDRVLALCRIPLASAATGLFPKGRSWAAELTKARESWRFEVDVLPSAVDQEGKILRIRNLAGRSS